MIDVEQPEWQKNIALNHLKRAGYDWIAAKESLVREFMEAMDPRGDRKSAEVAARALADACLELINEQDVPNWKQ